MNVLLIHVPKLEDFYLPFGRYMNVNYMPMGMLGIADYLRDNGHNVNIVHAGVEKILDRNWSVTDYISHTDAAAVGLSLHWHYQSYDCVEACKKIKQTRPDILTFVGGITASYFGTDVLKQVPELDVLVRGEAFEPIKQLLDRLDQGEKDFSGIPNLVWRRGKNVVENPETILHPQELFDSLSFANFSCVENHEVYVRQFGFPLAFSWELSAEENRKLMTMGRAFFPLFVGSGCLKTCSFCGGNRKTHERIFCGHRLLFRSHNAVVRDMKEAQDYGYKTAAVCFDPVPLSTQYYVELFSKIRREQLDMDLYFECWALPDKEFLVEFARTFSQPHSYLALSPDSGSEWVRKKNKGYYYSNEQLVQTLKTMEKLGIQADIFFSIGLPYENIKSALETQKLIRHLASSFSNIRRLMTWAIQLEPGSLMFEQPDRFGIETARRTFADFVQAHKVGSDAYTVLGYKIKDYFGDHRDTGSIAEFESHFQDFKCRNFCFHSKDPRVYNDPKLGQNACLEKRKVFAQRRRKPLPRHALGRGILSYSEAEKEEKPHDQRIEI